jgi:hypothetical protein
MMSAEMATAIVFIPLTQGKVAVVDFNDFELVRGCKWHAHKNGARQERWCACRTERNGGKKRHVFIHQVILGVKGVDHINGDSLDNRRSNLRIVSHAENCRGFKRKPLGSTSKYRGVFRFRNGRWAAHIGLQSKGSQIHLGYFSTEEDAARAYDAAAIRYGFSVQALNFKCHIVNSKPVTPMPATPSSVLIRLTLPGFLPATRNRMDGCHWSVKRSETKRSIAALRDALRSVSRSTPSDQPTGTVGSPSQFKMAFDTLNSSSVMSGIFSGGKSPRKRFKR